MVLDNFEIIKPLLKFESEDEFYFIQILKRRKENPEMHGNSRTIRTYCVKSQEYFDNIKDEIESLCKYHNARAYIHLSVRSFEKVGEAAIDEMNKLRRGKQFNSMPKAWNSACGKTTSKNKNWVVDIDTFDDRVVTEIKMVLYNMQPVGNKIIAQIPTINGFHLISKPFNLEEFRKKDLSIDIHKNNPTLLYYSNNKL